MKQLTRKQEPPLKGSKLIMLTSILSFKISGKKTFRGISLFRNIFQLLSRASSYIISNTQVSVLLFPHRGLGVVFNHFLFMSAGAVE